jgi:tetratricopeptide (TPR) repeat protein
MSAQPERHGTSGPPATPSLDPAVERRARRLRGGLALAGLLLLALTGGGWWYQREQAVRAAALAEREAEQARKAAALERDVTAALRETQALGEQAGKLVECPDQGEALLKAALAALKRAEDLLARGEPTDELSERVEAVRADLAEVARGRRLVVTLEEIRLRQEGLRDDTQGTAPRYREAFREYGLDVLGARTAETASRLRASALNGPLRTALEDWARVTPDKAERERLEQVLRATDADGGKWRDRWRAALAGKGREALKKLATEAEAGALPAAALANRAADLLRAGAEEEAILLLREGLRRYPADFWLNQQLARALHRGRSPQLEEAIRYYVAARALRGRSPGAHNQLGLALQDKGLLDEAIVCYRAALRLDPKNAAVHNNLGAALLGKGQVEEALLCCREAVRLDPRLAQAHVTLGEALQRQGHFAEALTAFKRGRDLFPPTDPRLPALRTLLHQCQVLLAYDHLLSLVLQGTVSPATAEDGITLAELAWQPYKKRYAASARLYRDAFAARPELAGQLRQEHRYNAAGCAVLASAGQGRDAAGLDEKERVAWRRQALEWLQADLAAWEKLPADKATVRRQFQHWRKNPDLASVRDPGALAKLPADEQAAWRKLWADVDALLRRVEQ